MTRLERLPKDVLYSIITNLDHSSILQLSYVSWRMERICFDYDFWIWKLSQSPYTNDDDIRQLKESTDPFSDYKQIAVEQYFRVKGFERYRIGSIIDDVSKSGDNYEIILWILQGSLYLIFDAIDHLISKNKLDVLRYLATLLDDDFIESVLNHGVYSCSSEAMKIVIDILHCKHVRTLEDTLRNAISAGNCGIIHTLLDGISRLTEITEDRLELYMQIARDNKKADIVGILRDYVV